MRRLTADAVLISLSLILFFVEGLLPPLILPPGAKFGLANVVTLAALYLLSEVDALIILLARIFLAGMFAGSPTVIFFSLSGGLLSLAAMIFMSSQKIFRSRPTWNVRNFYRRADWFFVEGTGTFRLRAATGQIEIIFSQSSARVSSKKIRPRL